MFSGNKKELTQDEKLDFVFKYIKNKQKLDNFKFILKLILFCSIAFFYIYIIPKLDYNMIFEKYFLPKFTDIVKITEDKIVKNETKNLINNFSNSGTEINYSNYKIYKNIITDDMIKKVRSSLIKN